MAQIIVTPQARRDLEDATAALGLPGDIWIRVARSLRVLETFPLAGPKLDGRWASARFIIGPWPWMILLYHCEKPSDRVFVVAMHDARSATSATAIRP